VPWILEIHVIDVGQGESTLLVADDLAGETRSMLIDGGEAGTARRVHEYVTAVGAQVDHLVTSHYDDDHSGGILALLIADNVYAVASAIAQTVGAQLTVGTRAQQIAGFAAAACSAVLGAYGPAQGQAAARATAARLGVGGVGDAAAATFGIEEAEGWPPAGAQPRLNYSTTTRRDLAKKVAISAADAVAAGANVEEAARTAALTKLIKGAPAGSKFSTGGHYADVNVIDIGASPHEPAAYQGAIAGTYTTGGTAIAAPGLNRHHTPAPALRSELLFNSGAAPVNPPANAPAAVVAAINRTTLPNGAVFPPSSQPDNDVSLGLVVQFNNFLYWTAGDLPWQGENLVGNAVMAAALPRPGGGNFPLGTKFACFKAGHHGANTATSEAFLKKVKPSGALISCGFHQSFQHPGQAVIERLHNRPSVQRFFLTNCNFETRFIPASEGRNQLTAANNKSRVAGDNRRPNRAPGRSQGDIQLTVTEANSLLGAIPGRQYRVDYWEEDAKPPAVRPDISTF
jgi:beta-lactamase superfamily II metal-dependent hydrolase